MSEQKLVISISRTQVITIIIIVSGILFGLSTFLVGYQQGLAVDAPPPTTTTTTYTVKEPVTVTGAIVIDNLTAIFMVISLSLVFLLTRYTR